MGQFLTYLYVLLLPVIILNLIYLTYPTKIMAKVITKSAPWRLRGKPRTIRRTRVKKYKVPETKHQNKTKKPSGATMRTYLFPALFTTFKVGCQVEVFLQQYSGPPYSHLAFQSKQALQPTSPSVQFDADISYWRRQPHIEMHGQRHTSLQRPPSHQEQWTS